MVVIVTVKSDEDTIKNEGAKSLNFIYFTSITQKAH